MQYFIIIIMLCAAYVIEVFHDHSLEHLFDKKQELCYVKKWHQYDFVFHALVAVLIAYITFGISGLYLKAVLIILHIGFLRMLILNSGLNLLRKRKIYYLGSTSQIDKLLKKYEKNVFIFLVLINIVLPIILIKT